VVCKPAGVLVHPVTRGQGGTLADALVEHFRDAGLPDRVHLVHRLDRDSSGLLVVAKSVRAHRLLARQLARRTLRREYLAFVLGEPEADAGLVDTPIGRHPTDPPLRAVTMDGEPARTRYHVLERYGAASLVRLELETGRTHQIRVHLEHLGHPVLGDRWYGRAGLERIGRQALHAARLTFVHPGTQQAMSLEAPLPEDMAMLRARFAGSDGG